MGVPLRLELESEVFRKLEGEELCGPTPPLIGQRYPEYFKWLGGTGGQDVLPTYPTTSTRLFALVETESILNEG